MERSEIIYEVNFRKATLAELEQMQELFVQTIMGVCHKDYNADQLRVWSSSAKNMKRWEGIVKKQYCILAYYQTKLVGMASLENGNYIDLLYVHKEFQNIGIAGKLFEMLKMEALNSGASDLKADVSFTARSFFESKGFRVEKENRRINKGIEIINFSMRNVLN